MCGLTQRHDLKWGTSVGQRTSPGDGLSSKLLVANTPSTGRMSASVLKGASRWHSTESTISKLLSSFFTASKIITSHCHLSPWQCVSSELDFSALTLDAFKSTLYQITRSIFLKCEASHVTPQFSTTSHCNENKRLTPNPAWVYYSLSLSVVVHSGCYNRTPRLDGL